MDHDALLAASRCLDVLLSSGRPMMAQTRGRVRVEPSAGTHRPHAAMSRMIGRWPGTWFNRNAGQFMRGLYSNSCPSSANIDAKQETADVGLISTSVCFSQIPTPTDRNTRMVATAKCSKSHYFCTELGWSGGPCRQCHFAYRVQNQL